MFHALTGGEVGKRIGGGRRTRTAFGTEEEEAGTDGGREEGTYGIVCVFLSGRLCLRLI